MDSGSASVQRFRLNFMSYGPAARKCAVGDVVIIISYASMDFEEAKKHTPTLVFPDTNTNRLI
jgi:aspartate 1-decarboxylase